MASVVTFEHIVTKEMLIIFNGKWYSMTVFDVEYSMTCLQNVLPVCALRLPSFFRM